MKRNGELYEKLVYRQRKLRRDNPSQQIIHTDESANDGKEIEELLEFFASCILPRDEQDLLKILKDSIGVRLRGFICILFSRNWYG